jgi:hypothetical protein
MFLAPPICISNVLKIGAETIDGKIIFHNLYMSVLPNTREIIKEIKERRLRRRLSQQ